MNEDGRVLDPPIMSTTSCTFNCLPSGIPLIPAFFIRTRDSRSFLEDLFHQVRRAALLALFQNGFVGGAEVALGVIRAAVEDPAAESDRVHRAAVLGAGDAGRHPV